MNMQPKADEFEAPKRKQPKRRTFQWTEDKIALASKLWAEGLTGPTIAAKMGVSQGSVTSMASKYRDLFPSRMLKGMTTRDGKRVGIPEAWLKRAARLWMDGFSANKIAEITHTKGSTTYHRIKAFPDLFPERREESPLRLVKTETRLGDSIVIRHTKRTRITGETHTMPYVSIIDGGSAHEP